MGELINQSLCRAFKDNSFEREIAQGPLKVGNGVEGWFWAEMAGQARGAVQLRCILIVEEIQIRTLNWECCEQEPRTDGPLGLLFLGDTNPLLEFGIRVRRSGGGVVSEFSEPDLFVGNVPIAPFAKTMNVWQILFELRIFRVAAAPRRPALQLRVAVHVQDVIETIIP